jgi:soluble lytic murein transglycosylase-like protein
VNIGALSAGGISASGWRNPISAIENRVQQLEGMLKAFEKTTGHAPTLPFAPQDVLKTLPKPSSFSPYPAMAKQSAYVSGLNEKPYPTATPFFKAFLSPAPQVNAPEGASNLQGLDAPSLDPMLEPMSIEAGRTPHKAQAFQTLIDKYAQLHGVDKDLVHSVIQQESGYNPHAVSRSGAQGLMQLMPSTAKSLGVSNPRDPEQNIEGGVRLLKGLLNQYRGNIPLALAAYNAGSGAVQKYQGIPPYRETQHYVKSILADLLHHKNRAHG